MKIMAILIKLMMIISNVVDMFMFATSIIIFSNFNGFYGGFFPFSLIFFFFFFLLFSALTRHLELFKPTLPSLFTLSSLLAHYWYYHSLACDYSGFICPGFLLFFVLLAFFFSLVKRRHLSS